MKLRVFQSLAIGSVLCTWLVAPLWSQQTGTPGSGATGQNQPANTNQTGSDQRQMPLPPIKGILVGSEAPPDSSEAAVPDTHALTGAEAIGVGALQRPHDVLDFAGHFGQTADSGIVPGQVTSASTIGGSVDFNRTWGHYHTTVVYNGADLLYYPNAGSYDQQSHILGFSQDMEWARWVIRLRNDLVVSPQAGFGGLDTGGLGFSQLGLLSTILPAMAPNETILTGYAMRLDDAALAEIDYRTSRRATVTVSGSYGVLRFLRTGYIDSHQADGRVGYNIALSPRNTLGFIYDYTLLGYTGLNERTTSNLAQVAFGRQVLGRLAFQVSAGPQQIQLVHFGSSTESHWAWNVYGQLTYAARRTNYSLSFSRGLVAGGGVLLGAYGDLVSGTISRQLSHSWAANGEGGYARNESVATSAAQPTPNTFSNYYVGANVVHNLTRHLVLALTYELQRQLNGGVCPVASCGLTGLRQVGGFTLDWHTQKIALN